MCNRLILPDFASFIQEKQRHAYILSLFFPFLEHCVYFCSCVKTYTWGQSTTTTSSSKNVYGATIPSAALWSTVLLEEEGNFSCFSCVVLFVPNISSTAAFALCTPCDHKNKLKTNKQYTVYCTEEKYSRLPVLVSQNARIYYTSTTFFVKLHEREQPQFLEAEWPLSMCSCSLLMKLLLSIS